MQWNKVVISFLFLFAYLTGAAHNLIPHSQDYLSNNPMAFTHRHHQHTQGLADDSDHFHVLHNHHFDNDLFDLLVCLFNETKHSDNTCNIQHYLPGLTNDFLTKKQAAAKLFGVLVGIGTNEDQDKKVFCFTADIIADYLSPVLANSPHRGPPFS